MTTLASGVGADIDDSTFTIDAPVAEPAQLYSIGSEVIRYVSGTGTTWSVRRGIGTARTSHSMGATLTAIYPVADTGGGGSLTVTDGVNPPVSNVTSIQLPIGSVSDLGAGTAGAILPPVNLIGTDPDTTPLSVQAATAQNSDAFKVLDENSGIVLYVGAGAGAQALGFQDPNGSTHFTLDGLGHLSLEDSAGNEYLGWSGGGGTNPTLQLGPGGATGIRHEDSSGNDYFFVAANAAPPDAFMFSGSCWFWFDKTEGAAKLMVKGKDQGGNIVTAAIPLA